VSAKYINNLTGVQSVELFEAMFDMCNIKNAAENLRLRGRGLNYDSDSNRIHRRLLTPIDGMFLCLVRCRTGLSEELIGLFFGVSQPVVSRVFEMWLMHFDFCFKVLFPPPDAKMRVESCPEEFVSKFKTAYAYIVDCSDLEMQVGSTPALIVDPACTDSVVSELVKKLQRNCGFAVFAPRTKQHPSRGRGHDSHLAAIQVLIEILQS
jgi:hypothetical protein